MTNYTEELEKKAEELEKKAEEYVRTLRVVGINMYNHCDVEKAYCKGYEQGYEDCRHYTHDYYKPKWHNLRKDPNDLPTECKNVLCFCDGMDSSYYCVGHLIKIGDDLSWWLNIGSKKLFNVIAWCELPKFEE